ncbi:hypothetical protein BGI41_03820 [Methanobrevibacter sp. 87.7]|uniref:zinc ribbon domain-containing protein n=1 Tax=Methanobrevibacter sp. 87.7 TaxID=387957 RepID=UPI000B507BA5|nr:zinc ribbon domain-containing protein [Methanobrevibacter sp. 87.7]OWT33159.1 hypothetical protein BGI41_03820 [Methanobrevibacter sp. 87.7]
MKTKCPICGKESEGNEKFCKDCGAELTYKNQKITETPSDETNNIKTTESDNKVNEISVEEKNDNLNQIKNFNNDYLENNKKQKKVTEKSEEHEINSDKNELNPNNIINELEDNEILINEIPEYKQENTEQNTEIPKENISFKKLSEDNEDTLVNNIFNDEEKIEENVIYPIHTVEKNPYAELTKSDEYFEEEFLKEQKKTNKPKKRKRSISLNKLFNRKPKNDMKIAIKNGLKHVHKHVTLILIALIIIALVATFTFNIIEENTINYLNPVSNAQGEFSNKIITFSIPSDWQSYNTSQNQTNVIGNFKSEKDNHKILLSVYQSKSSSNNITEIKRSTEELDIRSGALINSSTNRNVNNLTGYDVISKNGTNGYEYRTIGFIKENKEYAFLFVSDDIDSFNEDINYIINSIKFNKNL